jgi:rhodanese-related sulfurtransferase
MIPRLLLITLVFVTVPAFRVSAEQSLDSHISAAELLARIQAGSAPAIVDVRSRGEFDAGHLPGAVHLPFWAVFFRTSEVPAPKHEPVVVYCAHGPRAGLAKAALRLSGYQQVLYLEGHMSAWKKAGLPVERAP